MSHAEIARRTGFKPGAVCGFAKKWKVTRDRYQQRLLKDLEKTTKEQCRQLIGQTLELVEKKLTCMQADAGSTQKLTVGDVQKLVDVIGELHKISQLEGGDPTAIQANLRLTHAQVTEKLRAADPLINYDAPPAKPDKATSH